MIRSHEIFIPKLTPPGKVANPKDSGMAITDRPFPWHLHGSYPCVARARHSPEQVPQLWQLFDEIWIRVEGCYMLIMESWVNVQDVLVMLMALMVSRSQSREQSTEREPVSLPGSMPGEVVTWMIPKVIGTGLKPQSSKLQHDDPGHL